MFHVDLFDFNNMAPDQVSQLRHNQIDMGVNWPVVYVINNDKEAYVGETVNVSKRIGQHLQNEKRQRLTEIRIISDDHFNKSVILDLEAFLIRYMAADKKYILQNDNRGIRDHEYFDRLAYKDEFKRIWNWLRKKGVVDKSIEEIENSELYKYSPYKSLGEEQIEVETRILNILGENSKDRPVTILVRGGAGTGKTILAIYLIKLLADIGDTSDEGEEMLDEYFEVDDVAEMLASEQISNLKKIGIVVPQKSLQTSLKDVFSGIRHLNKDMVLTPAEVVKEYKKTGKKFDLLLVDEGHRLKCRYGGLLANYQSFDQCNRDLGLDKDEGTELDWIMLCSRHQIIFRDEMQTVRPCDIETDDFMRIIRQRYREPLAQLALDTQWRCQGGSDYTEYIKDIFAGKAKEFRHIENYDLKMFEHCHQMVDEIKEKNDDYGLCRVAAGYAWPWNRKKPDEYTIEIQGYRYRWNRTHNNWITSPTALDEIGCIHTVQGYDLNYAGIIIGEDLRYNALTCEIYGDKSNYYDKLGKSGVADDPEALKSYLCNIYTTLLTRGIKGTYLYVCDDALKEYMSQFFEVVKG